MNYIGWGLYVAISIIIQSITANATTDVEAGEKVFQRACAACHSLTPGKKMNGPSLAGVIGRPVGEQPGYAYSTALVQAKGVWDVKKLDVWLTDPRTLYPGTKMVTRLPSSADRSTVIAYLKTRPIK